MCGRVAGEEHHLKAEWLVSIGYFIYFYWLLIIPIGSNLASQLEQSTWSQMMPNILGIVGHSVY